MNKITATLPPLSFDCRIRSIASRLLTCARAVYALFKRLFGCQGIEQAAVVSEGTKTVKGSCAAKQLAESLKATFKSKVQYTENKKAVTDLGTYFFEHLLQKGRGGVEFDPKTKIYTVRFPQERRVPLIFSEKTTQKLNGRVVDPMLYCAKAVQFKLGKGNMEIIGDSLTASAKIKAGMFGEFGVGATVEGVSDEAPFPKEATHLAGSIRLNEGTNAIVRGIVNNVICPLFKEDLSNISIRRDRAIQTLHQTLYPQS